ncbi:bifunctional (p)ppGpp synthetase/guanosine-3',5'-bis(diphosphate) 3'-pyrophosphohydrolase [Candidatus Saccharibacteria bacterium]|nr:bifunctional (p)ppGpp synthetase/guanosine-3',5'-bis(diphosphate) 3'-pyrophosphohydrolase [Candidatus Saccharibacteria bacterium]
MSSVYEPDGATMFTYLRGRLDGPGFEQSRAALVFARKAHAGQTRKNGAPYIVHPLSMACDAIACKGATDEIVATILLHDVCEDCNIPLSALPVNDVVRQGVKLMTIRPFDGEEKPETKRRYFHELLDSKEAIICKAFDRYANLNDADGALTEEAIVKNIVETHTLLMPMLKEAKYEYPELSDMLHTIRTALKRTLNMMAKYHHVELR